MKKYFILVCLFLASCSQGDDSSDIDQALSQAYQFTGMLNQRSLEALIPYFSETEFTLGQLEAFCQKLNEQIGKEVSVSNERIIQVTDRPPYFKYTRHSTHLKSTRPVVTIFGFRKDGKIFEFSVETQPMEYVSPYSNYETKTDLSLPFNGEWFVVWGGRSYSLNNHAGSQDQRFAYDFTVLKDQTFRTGDGKSNKDYFSFDQPVLAPGSGVVSVVVDSEPENTPGEMTNTGGNYIVIDHRNGEYSFLCHLKRGSVEVTVGQEIRTGDHIAQCGNSGHSTAPGLHYHLQNTPVLFKGEGLPAQFQSYMVESRRVKRGEPVWGQNVWNARDAR